MLKEKREKIKEAKNLHAFNIKKKYYLEKYHIFILNFNQNRSNVFISIEENPTHSMRRSMIEIKAPDTLDKHIGRLSKEKTEIFDLDTGTKYKFEDFKKEQMILRLSGVL